MRGTEGAGKEEWEGEEGEEREERETGTEMEELMDGMVRVLGTFVERSTDFSFEVLSERTLTSPSREAFSPFLFSSFSLPELTLSASPFEGKSTLSLDDFNFFGLSLSLPVDSLSARLFVFGDTAVREPDPLGREGDVEDEGETDEELEEDVE